MSDESEPGPDDEVDEEPEQSDSSTPPETDGESPAESDPDDATAEYASEPDETADDADGDADADDDDADDVGDPDDEVSESEGTGDDASDEDLSTDDGDGEGTDESEEDVDADESEEDAAADELPPEEAVVERANYEEATWESESASTGDDDADDDVESDADDEDEEYTLADQDGPATYTPGAPPEPTTGDPLGEEEDEGLFGSGPETDEEMPLADHIEEMMRRLAVVFFVGGVVSLAVLGFGEVVPQIPTAVDIIDLLWNHNIPGAPAMAARRPRVYGPLELVLTKLKVAGLAGILVGLPVLVYETYLFMRPGLFPRERRYYLAAVPTSLILATIGMLFAHFFVLPAIFSYFTAYTTGGTADIAVAFGLKETFNLIILLMGYMAIVFQIPLFIMLAIMMNIVTRVWLEDKRLLFWGAFLGLAFLVSPDPTGMAPIIIATTMVVLYEGTLALLRWTGN